MNILEKTYKRNISSENPWRQAWGAVAKHFGLFILLIVFVVLSCFSICKPCDCSHCCCGTWCTQIKMPPANKIIWLITITLFLIIFIGACNAVSDASHLLRKERRITLSQIWKLAAIGIWIVLFVLIFDIQNNAKVAAAVGIIGVVLGWIFQDRVKGVIAFITLRRNRLLNIGDWIRVPAKDVDGEIKKISLTTVTLSNWDTTTSTIPISMLQSEHFINLQKMSDGKTYGRKMLKTFILDTGWIHPISEEEANAFLSADNGILDYLPKEEINPGVLNAHLYRLYLYHWLMNHPHISQLPRLIVRWMDQESSGMTLQVYGFITDANVTAFEWQQSQIVEHIITSMDWFGLRLYQSPSAYDVSYSNIRIIDGPETDKKEDKR